MFARILVALDASPNNNPVFEAALALAQLTQARLLLAHILPDRLLSDPLTASDIPLRSLHDSEAQGLEMLRSFHTHALNAGVNADLAQPLANPGDEICELAIEWGADLIVMGRRALPEPHNGASPSSISNYVMHHTVCPVLVLHQDAHMSTFNLNQQVMPLLGVH